MNTILRESRETKQQFYDSYKMLLSRVSKEISRAVAASEPGCILEIPPKLPHRPEYDHHDMAVAVYRSVRRCKGFLTQLHQYESLLILVVTWSKDITTRKKQHIFEDILRKARFKVSEYVKSQEYKRSRVKSVDFIVPARIPGQEGFDVYTASMYVVSKLQEDGFSVSVLVNQDLLPVLTISWDHIL